MNIKYIISLSALVILTGQNAKSAAEFSQVPGIIKRVTLNENEKSAIQQVDKYKNFGGIGAAIVEAIKNDDIELARSILENPRFSFNINIQNKGNGGTLLTYAIKRRNLRAVQLLLEFGANSTLIDDWGNSPLDLANSMIKGAANNARMSVEEALMHDPITRELQKIKQAIEDATLGE